MSGARRAGHRQRVRRSRRARAADHGRQRLAVRAAPAAGGHRGAGAPQAIPARQKNRRGEGRRQVGAARAVRGFRLSFSIDFRHPVIERSTQSVTVDFAETSYLKEIARARTFGFMHEVEDLQGQRPCARRRARQRRGARRARRAEQRGPALRRRVHPPQAARRDRRPVSARPAAARRLHRAQVGACAQQPAGARRARRRPARSRPWCSSAPRKRPRASLASPPSSS